MFDKNKNSWRPKGYRKDENPRERNDANKPVFNGGARPRFSEFSQDNRADNNGRQRPRFKRDMSSTQPRSERVHTSRMGEKVNYYGATDKERISRPRFTEQSDGTTFRPNVKRNANVYSKKKAFEYKQAYEDPTKPIRLNKYLANAGICSRREADDFIQAGVITVNGEVVENLGAKVLPTDKVMFHNQPVRREKKVYILLNKPKNTVTTTDDPEERRTVLDIVRNACAERIYPVGRLDRNTTGVLLLTNDGDLAAKLTHPKFGKKKIYAVTLDRELLEDDEQLLRDGIVLDNERIVPDALEFPKEDRLHIGLEIHSGQNRVVRRMFEKVGYKVMQLDRVSFAGLTKKNVARGKYRFLTPKEVSMLQMGAFE
ncbi:MAG: rRNA pseudouridine synthase [Paludibacteraceae bacterium]|nr:rRNA pseudouridine synthase [Paludibacteraceae bacterium]